MRSLGTADHGDWRYMESVEPKRTGEQLKEWNVTNAKNRLD